MNEIKPTRPLSTDELRGVFESALDRKTPRSPEPGRQPTSKPPTGAPPRRFDINALAALSDREFVEQAYAGILRRRADEPGIRHYAATLAAGASRMLLLGELRYSSEGRATGVIVPGLRARFLLHRLYRIRLVGRWLRTATAVAALPGLVRDIGRFGIELRALRLQSDQAARALEREMRSRADQADRGLDRLDQAARAHAAGLEQLSARLDEDRWVAPVLALDDRIEAQAEGIEAQAEGIEAQSARLEVIAKLATELAAELAGRPQADVEARARSDAETGTRFDEIRDQLARTGSEAAARLLQLEASLTEQRNLAARAITLADTNRAAVRDQERRLSLILGELRGWIARGGQFDEAAAARAGGHQDHLLDQLYIAFEDRFRGSRADIKERQRVYLDLLRECGAGQPDRPIVDVGSGRGELLELLREEGLAAGGVDLNQAMVALCLQAGLDCESGDAVAYLSGLRPGSLGAVTGFHIIEHLPFTAMVALFDAALRALATGGVVVFETPNPANLLVASRWFHLDPTHRNPLPAEMVSMIAEARGFVQVSIRELHPMQRRFEATDPVLAAQLDSIFHGPQDYALIARKP